jgi:hypothetical protein
VREKGVAKKYSSNLIVQLNAKPKIFPWADNFIPTGTGANPRLEATGA